MKVLVCGSRNWTNQRGIEAVFRKFLSPEQCTIVHGGCRGADTLAGEVALRLGHEVRVYPADWDKYGKMAGILRNQMMLKNEHPDEDGVYLDLVLAFHEDPQLGRGTKDMVQRARRVEPSVEVKVFTPRPRS